MDRLPTRVNRVDPDYQNRRTHNLELIETLRSRLDAVSEGGGGKYVERHRSRGKMLARERIQKIIDPGMIVVGKGNLRRAGGSNTLKN